MMASSTKTRSRAHLRIVPPRPTPETTTTPAAAAIPSPIQPASPPAATVAPGQEDRLHAALRRKQATLAMRRLLDELLHEGCGTIEAPCLAEHVAGQDVRRALLGLMVAIDAQVRHVETERKRHGGRRPTGA